MQTAIVTTTIREPALFAEYCRNLREHGHEEVGFLVVGDRKTPSSAGRLCRQLTETFGYPVEYYDVERQLAYLEPHAALAAHLPFDSIQRRNVGLLAAYEQGAEVVVTVDDDNFLTAGDFLGTHRQVGSVVTREAASSSTGWFNVCSLLLERQGRAFYHRGFPTAQRSGEEQIRWAARTGRVVVNAGLWLGEPDVDAVTRLALPAETVGLRPEGSAGILLSRGTWCPFNSQNTALARETIPAYFLSPCIGRYDDIWASFCLRVIIDHLGDAVQYGPPLVRQVRNPHNLWRDLDAERVGGELTDRVVGLLRRVTLTAGTYRECFKELVGQLEALARTAPGFADEERAVIQRVLEGMRVWWKTFQELPVTA